MNLGLFMPYPEQRVRLENTSSVQGNIILCEILKVPITPKIFFCPGEWLCHAEQNGEKIFVFGQNWNFLRIFKIRFVCPTTG